MKVIFMGTPEFAVHTLKGVLSSNVNVALVVTQPDRPKGRGLEMSPSPVKALALKNNLDVITPKSIRSAEFAQRLSDIKPDLIIVSAYGKIIPKNILDIPKLYPINVHASLLPKYRGAAPINWAIVNGETKTGITIMKVNPEMDAGDIMFKRSISIDPDENAKALHDRLALLGEKMIVESIDIIRSGKATFDPQIEKDATYAPLLKKTDGLIDWKRSSQDIKNFVRGMNPWPGAYSYMNDKILKIYDVQEIKPAQKINAVPGEILDSLPDAIPVQTGSGIVLIKELQLESRKRLKACDFSKGMNDLKGITLTETPVKLK